MTKKIAFSQKPLAAPQEVDAWVTQPSEPEASERIKRLTIDVPLTLHMRFKSKCAAQNQKMNEVIVAFLEAHCAEQ